MEPETPPAVEPAFITATQAVLAFYQVSGGNTHTCGITTSKGDGTKTNRSRPVRVVGAP